MHAWVDGADEVYAGAEKVFCIRRGQDIMSEGRVSAGGVDGGSVLVEGSVRFSDAEVMGASRGFWGLWGLGSSPGSSPGRAMPTPWCGRGGVFGSFLVFILVGISPPLTVE